MLLFFTCVYCTQKKKVFLQQKDFFFGERNKNIFYVFLLQVRVEQVKGKQEGEIEKVSEGFVSLF